MSELLQETIDWISKIAKGQAQCLVIGLNGPQGIGKTTFSTQLVVELQNRGKRALSISIDDFYLRHSEQLNLAKRFEHNRYLQQRGYPGTHDIKLGLEIIERIKSQIPGEFQVPRYDKSAHSGQGDRAPLEHWPTITPPIDFLIVEGWMLGFKATHESHINDPDFLTINRLLLKYDTWLNALDAFIQMKPADYRDVITWRVEAEENMKRTGKAGMSLEQIREYVKKFLPAYEAYLPELSTKNPIDGPILRVEIGLNRKPTKNRLDTIKS